jgi:hypothetical protein
MATRTMHFQRLFRAEVNGTNSGLSPMVGATARQLAYMIHHLLVLPTKRIMNRPALWRGRARQHVSFKALLNPCQSDLLFKLHIYIHKKFWEELIAYFP